MTELSSVERRDVDNATHSLPLILTGAYLDARSGQRLVEDVKNVRRHNNGLQAKRLATYCIEVRKRDQTVVP